MQIKNIVLVAIQLNLYLLRYKNVYVINNLVFCYFII